MAAVAQYRPITQQAEEIPCMDVQRVNVFFRFVDGKTHCLWIDDRTSVYALKKQLLAQCREDRFSAASQDLFLVWNGKPLDDDALLSDYSVQDNATIHVSFRNKGGCFVCSCSILLIIFVAFLCSFCTCGLSLAVIPFLLPFLFVLPLFCL